MLTGSLECRRGRRTRHSTVGNHQRQGHAQAAKTDRTASLAVVFPLAHVARLFTVGTAAVTVEARTTRERKTFENMTRLSKEEEKCCRCWDVCACPGVEGNARCRSPTSSTCL